VDLSRLHHPLDRRYMLGMARSLEFARSAARSDGLLAMNRVHDFALICEITRANQSRCGKTLLAIIRRRRRTERIEMEAERRIDVLGIYLAACGPSRAELTAMNTTLTRLTDSLTEIKLKDLIREGVRGGVKDLAKKANVDEIVKVSFETKKAGLSHHLTCQSNQSSGLSITCRYVDHDQLTQLMSPSDLNLDIIKKATTDQN
jgi:hypothetical protein